jgi:hypothetical protein
MLGVRNVEKSFPMRSGAISWLRDRGPARVLHNITVTVELVSSSTESIFRSASFPAGHR